MNLGMKEELRGYFLKLGLEAFKIQTVRTVPK